MDSQTPEQGVTTGGAPRPPASRRARRSDGERSYRAIMEAATSMATERGLDGLSIADLAVATGMSKGGLYAHFGSKLELQLATIAAAADIMNAQVIGPALSAPEPIARLRALFENFLIYAQHTFPGGCFFASAGSEFGARAGDVRELLVKHHIAWTSLLTDIISDACEAGQLDIRDKEPTQLAFEFDSFLHMANDSYVLHRDHEQIQRARRAVAWLLEYHSPDQCRSS
jgi:AcrR family transcriptional regulator